MSTKSAMSAKPATPPPPVVRDELDADDAVTIGASSPMEQGDLDADLLEVTNAILPITSIAPHPRNYNLHSDSQLARLQASDARFGQVRSIVVQAGAPGKYMLVAGHGYLESRKSRGKQYVRADVIPARWTAEQVEGYLVADNELARMGESDPELLAAILADQQAAGHDLTTMGLDEASYHDLLASLQEEHPPSLDDLESQFGEAPDAKVFWPLLRFQVPQPVKDLFDSLMDQMPAEGYAQKFALLLSCVNAAAAQRVDPAVLDALFATRDGVDGDDKGDDEGDDEGDDDDGIEFFEDALDESELDEYGDD